MVVGENIKTCRCTVSSLMKIEHFISSDNEKDFHMNIQQTYREEPSCTADHLEPYVCSNGKT